MRDEALSRFSRIYGRGHTQASGAAAIFNAFAGRPEGAPVPLSLSHGVDFNHCHAPMDLASIEPIHWCCNERIYARAAPVKPALLAPHPWIMLARSKPVPAGSGTLVIGPPPGPANDLALLPLLRQYGRDRATVLVKQVGAHRESARFWQSHGFEVTSIAPRGGMLYQSMLEVLSRFDSVVGFTFSSALVFAAAIGRNVQLVRGYRYRSYFSSDHFGLVDYGAADAQAVVQTFCGGDAAGKLACAEHLLGADLPIAPSELRERLASQVQQLQFGLYGLSWAPAWLKHVLFRLAADLDKPALARFDRETFEKLVGRREVFDVEMDETATWIAGSTARLVMVRRPYVPGETEPGTAVERYSAAAAGR